jgi:hypothetical protein
MDFPDLQLDQIGEGAFKKKTFFMQQSRLSNIYNLFLVPYFNRYYHELFLRGRSDLCIRMVRTRVKGNGSKAASSPATEPNFYVMEPCPRPEDGDSGSVPVFSIGIPMINEGEDEGELPLTMDEDELEEEFSRTQSPEPMIVHSDKDSIPMEEEEDPMTPISQTGPFLEENEEDDLGVISLEKPTAKAKFITLPPMVTPLESATRKLICRCGAPPFLPMICTLDDLPKVEHKPGEDIHSGDQVFFEGLPFHYLESKDIEDSLIHGET